MEWEPKREDKRNGNVVCFALAWMESKGGNANQQIQSFHRAWAGEERLSLFIWACRGALGPLGRRFIHSTHAAFAQLMNWISFINFTTRSLRFIHFTHKLSGPPIQSHSFHSINCSFDFSNWWWNERLWAHYTATDLRQQIKNYSTIS